MKGFVNFWFGTLILSMTFYYIPVYLFSNNMKEAIMSLNFKDAAPVSLINAMPPGMNPDDVKDELVKFTEKGEESGRFDTVVTLGDALKNNPNVQSADLIFGNSPEGMVMPIDPIYHDLDVGLRIKFREGSVLIIVFDAIGKSFLGGHGAKVFHVQDGFRSTPDGRNFHIADQDTLAQLVLSIFAHDKNELPSLYNKFFSANVPTGQSAFVNTGSQRQLAVNAQSNNPSAPTRAQFTVTSCRSASSCLAT